MRSECLRRLERLASRRIQTRDGSVAACLSYRLTRLGSFGEAGVYASFAGAARHSQLPDVGNLMPLSLPFAFQRHDAQAMLGEPDGSRATCADDAVALRSHQHFDAFVDLLLRHHA